MKNGHYAGFRIRKTGEFRQYYCPRHPDLFFDDLDGYDLHYDVVHKRTLPDDIAKYIKKDTTPLGSSDR